MTKPEVEAGSAPVSKAEVKHIQRNLKTMPLEDNRSEQGASKDMDDVESDQGSTGDAANDDTMDESSQQPDKALTPADSVSTPASDLGDQEADIANATAHSIATSSGDSTKSPSKPTTTPSVFGSKLSGGFSNTSSASPFASVKPGESVFGSSSTTLKGFGATSSASPFATVEKTNVFGSSSPLSGGFGNTSSASPFATAASSTNVFGSSSSKSVFGQPSTTTSSSAFDSSADQSNESTAGSVFGARSVIGSVVGSSTPLKAASPFASAASPSATSGSFSTFGAKNSFGKESNFTSGSFIDHGKSQDQGDFGSLLSQDVGENDGDNDQAEGEDNTFGASVYSNADQIDVQTGEEEEITIYQTKGKLYADIEKNLAWKERGKGTFKVNVSRKDTKSARLVMRTDGVLRLILNVAIFPEMNPSVTGDRYVRFVGVVDKTPVSFLLK
ncbi:hypothetical protein BGZ98_004939, partial [Dissophora globulifera]